MFKIKSLSDCKVSALMADVGNAGALFCLKMMWIGGWQKLY